MRVHLRTTFRPGRCSKTREQRPFVTYPPHLNPYGEGRDRMLQETKDYSLLYKSFKFPNPEYYNIGVDITDKHANHASNVALIYGDESNQDGLVNVTYGETIELSNRLANGLLKVCELKPQDRVAVLMSQSPETAIAHAAIFKLGCISLPLFVQFGPDAIEYRLNDSGAKVIIVEPSMLPIVKGLRDAKKLPHLKHIVVGPPLSAIRYKESQFTLVESQYGPGIIALSYLVRTSSSSFTPVKTLAEDPAVIIYTSGTTGNPKGALHAHRVLLGHLPGVEFPHNFFPQPGDLFWTTADWAWIGGLIDALLPSMHHGVPIVAHRFKKFDGEKAFELIAKHKVKNMFMPPTALKLMRQVPNPRARWNYSVRSIGSGGETLGAGLLDWGKEVFGVTINEFYGQTESNLVLGNCSAIHEVRPGSMGLPIPGHVVEIVGEDGKVLPQGQVGNIGIKAPHPVMFLRYWNKPEATKAKYAGDFLLTGDLGKKDEDGYFWFFGRADDVIKSAGYRIGPDEIEACLMKHEAVSFAAVVGVPDETRGENIKAYIVLQPPYQEKLQTDEKAIKASIQDWVKGRLAKYEYPRIIEFVSSLPLGPTGKVLRRELRQQHIDKQKSK